MTPISRLRQFVGRCLGRSSAAERLLRSLDFPAAEVPRAHRWLADEGIQAWISGGWGIDAIAGQQTRPHRDLDLLVAIDDGDHARRILEAHGFELYPPEIGLPFRLAMLNRRARLMIDLQLASPNPDGTYTFRVIDARPDVPSFDYVYSVEGLEGRGTVAGVELPCISREEQVRSRTTQGYSFESPDRMREGGILADVHDLEVIDGSTIPERSGRRPIGRNSGRRPYSPRIDRLNTPSEPAAAAALAAPAPETVRLEPTRGFGRVLAPHELWRYRDLALQLAVRDITVRYRQTSLGAAWAVLQPVGFMVVFSLFFGRLAGVSSDGLPYALFSLAGLVPWTFFSTVLTLGSDSLVVNQALVSKIYFPRIFLPAGTIAAGLVDLAVSFVILIAIVLIWGYVPSWSILILPVLLVILVAAALGVTSGLAAVNVRYRDVRYVVPFLVQMWLFLTPIAYPSSLIGEPWRTLSAVNPMVGVVEGFRWGVLGHIDAPLALIGVSAASALLLLAAGLAYFDRVERSFADLI